MATVPQRTLNWLYSVLTKDHFDPRQTYHDPNRTYYDVAAVLAQYPSLSPRTDVYTYENGFSALLLHLVGTLPVSFRGTTYKFPIALWIPNTYPREAPIVYVTPTQDMAVRVGQHVTLEGRVYHHYLAHWADAWDKSSLVDFLSILREVFAKEPPVRYKQQPMARPPQPEPVQAPPPLPPLPPELGQSTVQTPSPQPAPQMPPRSPPKPGQPLPAEQQGVSVEGRYNSPPPVPPKDQDPRRLSHQRHTYSTDFGNRAPQHLPERAGTLGGVTGPPRPPLPHQHAAQSMSPYAQGPAAYSQGDNVAPVSPISPNHIPKASIASQISPYGPPPQGIPSHYPEYQQGRPQYQQTSPQQVLQQTQYHQRDPAGPAKPAAPAPKTETPDLLTSPFELELPSFAPSGPAPPIPPNPEKDALLHAVSKTVAETLQSNVSQSKSAAQSLLSQSQSLRAAIATLQGEIANLNNLNATLQSNTSVLQQSLHRADGVIADAQTRISSPALQAAGADFASGSTSDGRRGGLPPIDDVLVAPTVVGKQLYDLVAEERGIQQAIYALQAALVKGVIGVETWSRHTRGLAREAFLKRALIRKIGRGMGLEEEVR